MHTVSFTPPRFDFDSDTACRSIHGLRSKPSTVASFAFQHISFNEFHVHKVRKWRLLCRLRSKLLYKALLQAGFGMLRGRGMSDDEHSTSSGSSRSSSTSDSCASLAAGTCVPAAGTAEEDCAGWLATAAAVRTGDLNLESTFLLVLGLLVVILTWPCQGFARGFWCKGGDVWRQGVFKSVPAVASAGLPGLKEIGPGRS